MEYSRSIIEIIKERSSRRSYTPQPVEAEKLQALRDFLAAPEGPLGKEARFVILDTTGWGEGKINALGTYGTIQGARLFIVGIIRRGEHDMEDFGYEFEKIILRATDLGLGLAGSAASSTAVASPTRQASARTRSSRPSRPSATPRRSAAWPTRSCAGPPGPGTADRGASFLSREL